jgi:nicotinate-nucleotide pyrophosphorylase (carboxylating)
VSDRAQVADRLDLGATGLSADRVAELVARTLAEDLNGGGPQPSTLAVARKVPETGVGSLPVGALPHSSPILDLALDLRAAD